MIRSAFATHVTAGSGTTLQNLTYSWDQLGNLTERKDYSNNLDETYQYDELSRLTKVGLLTNGSPSGTENSYSYDLLGNMLTKSDVGSYNFPPAGSAHPHGLASINHVGGGSTTMTYDGNGDVVTEQGQIGRTITWTLFGQPASISYAGKTISFSYDADHNRVSQTSPEGTTIYLPDGEGFTPAGQSVPTWHTYFSADGQRVGEDAGPVGGSLQHHYFLNDPQGSIGMVTDDTFNPSTSGPIPQNQGYDTFGQPRNANGAPDPNWGANAITKRGYINQEHLTDVRLIDLNARAYDPQIGQFLSPDPVISDGNDSQAWNAYAYSRNNPMSREDPTGLDPLFNGIPVPPDAKIYYYNEQQPPIGPGGHHGYGTLDTFYLPGHGPEDLFPWIDHEFWIPPATPPSSSLNEFPAVGSFSVGTGALNGFSAFGHFIDALNGYHLGVFSVFGGRGAVPAMKALDKAAGIVGDAVIVAGDLNEAHKSIERGVPVARAVAGAALHSGSVIAAGLAGAEAGAAAGSVAGPVVGTIGGGFVGGVVATFAAEGILPSGQQLGAMLPSGDQMGQAYADSQNLGPASYQDFSNAMINAGSGR